MADIEGYKSGAKAPSSQFEPISGVTPPKDGGGDKISAAIDHFAQTVHKMTEAQDETRANRARSNAITRISALRTQYEQDKDFQTAPARFAEDARRIEQEETERVTDNHRRSATALYIRSHALTTERYVHNVSLAREAHANGVSLTAQKNAALADAIGAASPAEREAAIARFRAVTDSGASAGWIGEAQRVEENFTLDHAVDLDDAQKAIGMNPSLARVAIMDPNNFRTLDPAQRRAFSEGAMDAGIRSDAAAEAAPQRQAFQAAATGTLTHDALHALAPALPAAVLRTLDTAMTAAPAAASDPGTLWGLYGQANGGDPEALHVAATRALGAGSLSLEHARALDSAAAIAQQAPPEMRAVRARLVERLRPGDLQDADAARLQLGALPAFDQWLSQNPKVPPSAAAAQADELARGAIAQATATERQNLPLPRFTTAAREKFNPDSLAAAASRLSDARAAGMVDDRGLLAEVATLQRWQDLLGRETEAPK